MHVNIHEKPEKHEKMGEEIRYNGDTLRLIYTPDFIRYDSKQKRFPLQREHIMRRR